MGVATMTAQCHFIENMRVLTSRSADEDCLNLTTMTSVPRVARHGIKQKITKTSKRLFSLRT